jgi:hypothetical protein
MNKISLKYIEEKLPVGTCIHKTSKGNVFKIVEFKNEKVFFSIPNHQQPGKFYKKSISIERISEIYEKPNYDFKSFEYKDCRNSATKGLIKKLKSIK